MGTLGLSGCQVIHTAVGSSWQVAAGFSGGWWPCFSDCICAEYEVVSTVVDYELETNDPE